MRIHRSLLTAMAPYFTMAKPLSGVHDKRVYKLSEKWTRLRLIGSMTSVREFWIQTGRNGQPTWTWKLCACWDPVKEDFAETCAYCKAGLRGQQVYYSNAIIRKLQSDKAGGPSGVRIVRLTPRLHQQLYNLSRRQKKSGKWKMYDLAHARRGVDIRIRLNPHNGYTQYDVFPREFTRLTADEVAYQLVPLDLKPETRKQAKAAWRKLKRMREASETRDEEVSKAFESHVTIQGQSSCVETRAEA